MDSIPYQLALVPAEKRCPRCHEVKPVSDFALSRGKPSSYCRPCSRAYRREYHSHLTPEQRWNRKLIAARYNRGIEPGEFMRLLNEQGGVCAICRGLEGKLGLTVDHDHETGVIRGLLCGKCNAAISFLQEDEEIMQRAIAYVVRNK